jgi:hypothetical protein
MMTPDELADLARDYRGQADKDLAWNRQSQLGLVLKEQRKADEHLRFIENELAHLEVIEAELQRRREGGRVEVEPGRLEPKGVLPWDNLEAPGPFPCDEEAVA